MRTPVKATLVAAAVAVVLVVAAIVYILVNQSPPPPPEGGGGGSSDGAPSAVRESSHVLDDGGPDAVIVVEFLDFECEACGAFYPIVEDLREKYAGQITYVVRYFPLPGHANSKNAAIAAEAAAQQDRFEDMYHRLFETQPEWGEAQESRADLFRSFAEDLGLNMAAYDAAVREPAAGARVELDLTEGRALGVDSTPTFFLDGQKLELQTLNDLDAAIGAAVDGRR